MQSSYIKPHFSGIVKGCMKNYTVNVTPQSHGQGYKAITTGRYTITSGTMSTSRALTVTIFDFIFDLIIVCLLPNHQKCTKNEAENEPKIA